VRPNLLLNLLDIELPFRAYHLAVASFAFSPRAKYRPHDLAPIAVHHVRLVELDLDEGRAIGVRWQRGGADSRVHDEALERLAVSRPAETNFLRERPGFLHGRQLERECRNEAPIRVRTRRVRRVAECGTDVIRC
jgi:hypothetical protein